MTEPVNAASSLDAALVTMDRPKRIPAILTALRDKRITTDEAAKLVGEWWADYEFPTSNLGQWGIKFVLFLFRRLRELDPPQGLADIVTVYRGCSTRERKHPRGISWTLSRDRAEWFARRFAFGKPTIVLEAIISLGSILFVTHDREESEVIIDPKDISEFVVHKIT